MECSGSTPPLQVHEIVACRVVEVGQWGAYIEHPSGEQGFVDGMEFSWTSASTDHVRPGDVIRVKVMRLLAGRSGLRGTVFVASIREVTPELNPWFKPDIYRPGVLFPGSVMRSGRDFLIARLSTGALACVLPGGWRGRPPAEGEAVDIRLTSVDADDRKLYGVMQHDTSNTIAQDGDPGS
ncbi:MAG: S1 RNA-binding domain-containing protein [Alphaproteobacteria bacterium]|nr:S1 RNA-binding domain-containing protein [Alphaproteobacteria bacterium]